MNNTVKKIAQVFFKLLLILLSIAAIGIITIYLIFIHNWEKTVSKSPYTNHKLTVKDEGDIIVSYFKASNKTIFEYKRDRICLHGDDVKNVLWYQDSAVLYINGSYNLAKETIYYIDNSRKRVKISGYEGNMEIVKYYTDRIDGVWTSGIGTLDINTQDSTVIYRTPNEEFLDLRLLTDACNSFNFYRYNEIPLCNPDFGYILINQISKNKMTTNVHRHKSRRSRTVVFKKVE